jgi:hypothetical protein
MNKRNLINYDYLKWRENDFVVKNQELVAKMYLNPKFERQATAVALLRSYTEAFEEMLLNKQPGNKAFTDAKAQKRKQLEQQSKIVGDLLQSLDLPENELFLLIWEVGFPTNNNARISDILVPPTNIALKVQAAYGDRCTARVSFKKPTCKFLFTQLAIRFSLEEKAETDYFTGLTHKDLTNMARGRKMYVRARTVDNEGDFSEWTEEATLYV